MKPVNMGWGLNAGLYIAGHLVFFQINVGQEERASWLSKPTPGLLFLYQVFSITPI